MTNTPYDNDEYAVERPQSRTVRRMKRNAKIALSLLLIAVISLTTATYAWFSLSNNAYVSNITMEVSTGSKLRISTGFDEAGTKVDISDIDNYVITVNGTMVNTKVNAMYADSGEEGANADLNSMYKFRLSPLTSGDGVKLYTQNKNENGTADDAVKMQTGKFFQIDFMFMSTVDMYVYLNGDDTSDGKDDSTFITADNDTIIAANADVANKTDLGYTDPDNTATQRNVVDVVRMSFTPYYLNAATAGDAAATLASQQGATAVDDWTAYSNQGDSVIWEPWIEETSSETTAPTPVTLKGLAATDAGQTTQPTFTTLGANAGVGKAITALGAGDTEILFVLAADVPTKVELRIWIEGEDDKCVNGMTDEGEETEVNIELADFLMRLRFCGADENGEYVE